jgi:predicted RNA-binding protein with EMAP domain
LSISVDVLVNDRGNLVHIVMDVRVIVVEVSYPCNHTTIDRIYLSIVGVFLPANNRVYMIM